MSGTAPPTGYPPGPVQSPAAGTPTTQTVPVSYTAPTTGNPVITYAGETSTDNTTWVSNAGAFNATGGTFVNLASSTTTSASVYYLRVVATNEYGTSRTAFAAPVTMAVNNEASRSKDELILDMATAMQDILDLTVGGLIVSSVTGTRITFGSAIARYKDAVTAYANLVAVGQTTPPGGGGGGEGGSSP